MSRQKQSPKASLLREVGLQTKNANFDSTCKVCSNPINGTSPKCSVVAVKIPSESRKQTWIHADCVDIKYHLIPESYDSISDKMNPSQITSWEQLDGKPRDPTPKEETKMPTPKPTPTPTPKPIPASVNGGDPAGEALASMVMPHLMAGFTDHVDTVMTDKINALALPRTTVVKPLGDFEEVKVGLTHPCFDEALDLGRIRANCLASGPAGSGKTHAAKQIFDTLKSLPESAGGFAKPDTVRFTVISCHNEMMPSDIVGPMVPNVSTGDEKHRITEIVNTFRDGGVLVFDEFDRLMGGTAVAANMALANDSWTMPDGSVIHKSPDLFILATANTLGQGKGRSAYVSAETLDGATLNRFAGGVIRWGYDRAFERMLIGDDEIVSFFHDLRDRADKAGLVSRIISPRHMITAKKQKHILGYDMERIRRIAVRDWNRKDLKTIGFDDQFIDGALATNGGAA